MPVTKPKYQNVDDIPDDELTLEQWIWRYGTCTQGYWALRLEKALNASAPGHRIEAVRVVIEEMKR